jgi:ATP-dependent Clp protease protease subunit
MQLLRENAKQERTPLKLVQNKANADSTLYLYDVIDAFWGVSAKNVAEMLADADPKGTLHVRVNSPGGDVFEARAISTLLREFGGKTVAHVDGLAASAATTVACACGEIVMGIGSMFMIHNAWSAAYGNKNDMRDMASLLEQIDGDIVADYARVSKQDPAQIAAWMDAETWMTAEETVANGFAARLAVEPDGDEGSSEGDGTKNAARWSLSAFKNTPESLLKPPKPAPKSPDFAAIHLNNQRRMRLLNPIA